MEAKNEENRIKKYGGRLKLYNTLSRSEEVFVPLEEGKVTLYVCGTTEYDYVHLGHGRTYAFYDVLVRFLEWLGYDVFYIQNITDVGHLEEDADFGEDKVVKRARRERKHPMELVEFFMRKHFEAVDGLKIKRPNVMPRASAHIPEIIELAQTLVKKGYAYVAKGSVYFSVKKFPEYGKLSGVKPDEVLPGARVDVRKEKKDPRDFALWRKAPEGYVLKWSSPWGEGFPGWHIEDTVFILKYFGPQCDIHGGAVELIFPHHDCEISQAEAVTGVKPFVRYWVHTGLLTINGEKMAKSKGNYIRLEEALRKHSPEALRLWMASTHFRKSLDYNEKDLEAAEKNVERISNTLGRIQDSLEEAPEEESVFSDQIEELKENFVEAMLDDLNTSKALSFFFQLITSVNKAIDEGKYSKEDLEVAEKTIKELGEFFQIVPEPGERGFGGADIELVNSLLNLIIDIREKARERKDYDTADKIRGELRELGIVLEDTKEGAKWRITSTP
jgi:cysteinyl-tRNA synthetase